MNSGSVPSSPCRGGAKQDGEFFRATLDTIFHTITS